MEIGTNLEKSSFLSQVKNISILLLIGGILSLIMVFPYLIISALMGIIQLIIAIGLIVTSFGLRKMKKWGFYGYTIITLLYVIGAAYSFITSGTVGTILLIETAILVIILTYFWKISNKFN